MDVPLSRRLAALVLSALTLPLEATHPAPGPHFMHCRSEGDIVRLEWDHLGFTDGGGLEARLERDGSAIAPLRSSSLGYLDRGVPAGEHTYRLVVVEGLQTLDAVECRVSVGAGVPPPKDLQCSVQEKAPPCADLQWRNAAAYDSIVVRRDGGEIAVLEGGATRFTEQPGPGLHVYDVRGLRLGELSAAAACEADLGGEPFHRFHLVNLSVAGAAPQALPPSNQLAVMLDNSYPVSAWSFGLCSDPAYIAPLAIEVFPWIEALNLGAGPSFLAIDRHAGGFTMRAIVDEADPFAVLGAGSHRLLTLRYGGGPRAVPGEVYPLAFCGVLGEPPVPIALVINGRQVEPATEPGLVLVTAARFLRGDSNVDGDVNLTDGIFTLEWLFRGGRSPDCLDAADSDASRTVNITDALHTFNFLFLGGPRPPAPFPGCAAATVAAGCHRPGCP